MSQHSNSKLIPPSLRGWLTVSEVDDGPLIAGELFQHKYGHPVPDFGRHVVALYHPDAREPSVLSYLHFWRQGRIGLIGGGCTDGRVMRAMPPQQAAAINAAGGVLRQTLLYAFARFSAGIDAFFGRAGDTRAREVDFQAGFRATDDPHLLIMPVRDLTPEEQRMLFKQALAIGDF